MAAMQPTCCPWHMHMSWLTCGMIYAVATSQYSGAELKRALRRDIDDLARTKALQVQPPICLLHFPLHIIAPAAHAVQCL